jgi:hypothetical protein
MCVVAPSAFTCNFSIEGVPENSRSPTVYSTVAVCDGLYIVKLHDHSDSLTKADITPLWFANVFVYCVRSIILIDNNKSSDTNTFILWIVCG